MISRSLKLTAILAILASAPLAAGDLVVDGRFVSTTTSGPPLTVASTVAVPNLNADMVDGLHGTDLARKLGNVVTVAKSGGDFAKIDDALDSITDASSSNPYLVKVGPGRFACGFCSLAPNVHLVGVSPRATVLTSTGGTGIRVAGPGPSSIRRVGFVVESSSVTSTGIRVGTDAALRADELAIYVVGGTLQTTGVLSQSMLHLSRAEIRVEGINDAFGIRVSEGPARLESLGIHVSKAATGDPFAGNTGVRTSSNSQVEAVDLDITISGGGEGDYGIYSSGPLTVRDSRIGVSGGPGPTVYGIRILGGPTELSRVDIDVDGGQGIWVQADQPVTLRNSEIDAVGGPGIYVSDVGTIEVHHSRLASSSLDLSIVTGGSAYVVHSHLEGTGTASDAECRFTTDENLTTYGSICP